MKQQEKTKKETKRQHEKETNKNGKKAKGE